MYPIKCVNGIPHLLTVNMQNLNLFRHMFNWTFQKQTDDKNPDSIIKISKYENSLNNKCRSISLKI